VYDEYINSQWIDPALLPAVERLSADGPQSCLIKSAEV
jgi:hypothetical protein